MLTELEVNIWVIPTCVLHGWGTVLPALSVARNGGFTGSCSGRAAEFGLYGTSSDSRLLSGEVEGDTAWGKMGIICKEMTRKPVLCIIRFKGIKCESLVKKLKQEVWAKDKVMKQDVKWVNTGDWDWEQSKDVKVQNYYVLKQRSWLTGLKVKG